MFSSNARIEKAIWVQELEKTLQQAGECHGQKPTYTPNHHSCPGTRSSSVNAPSGVGSLGAAAEPSHTAAPSTGGLPESLPSLGYRHPFQIGGSSPEAVDTSPSDTLQASLASGSNWSESGPVGVVSDRAGSSADLRHLWVTPGLTTGSVQRSSSTSSSDSFGDHRGQAASRRDSGSSLESLFLDYLSESSFEAVSCPPVRNEGLVRPSSTRGRARGVAGRGTRARGHARSCIDIDVPSNMGDGGTAAQPNSSNRSDNTQEPAKPVPGLSGSAEASAASEPGAIET